MMSIGVMDARPVVTGTRPRRSVMAVLEPGGDADRAGQGHDAGGTEEDDTVGQPRNRLASQTAVAQPPRSHHHIQLEQERA